MQIWPNSRDMVLKDFIEKHERLLEKRKQQGLLRKLEVVRQKVKGIIDINGRKLIDFSSNDYLGLSSNKEMAAAAVEALETWGCGAGASRLMSGNAAIFHELEGKVAEMSSKDEALLFGSGYLANIGVISGLVGRKDCVFADRLVHASILDGIHLSRARLYRFRHNDASHLESLLKRERKKHDNALIVVESLYSMDGDVAPLKRITDLKKEYNTLLLVDEAHAVGILGPEGRGLVQEDVAQDADITVGTFGKAYGSYGAYAALGTQMKEILVNQARPFIFSTALPPHVAAVNLKAVALAAQMDSVRKKVAELSQAFRDEISRRCGLQCFGNHHIIPVIVGDNDKALEMQQRLKEKGFFVKAVRPPTVPDGTARLRISVTAHHAPEHVISLARAIAEHGLEINR